MRSIELLIFGQLSLHAVLVQRNRVRHFGRFRRSKAQVRTSDLLGVEVHPLYEPEKSSYYRSTWGAKHIPPSNRRVSGEQRPAGRVPRHPLETSPLIRSSLRQIGSHRVGKSRSKGRDSAPDHPAALSNSLQPAESHARKLLSFPRARLSPAGLAVQPDRGYSPIRKRVRYPHRPGTPRPPGRKHHLDLHPCPEPQPGRRAKPDGSASGKGGPMTRASDSCSVYFLSRVSAISSMPGSRWSSVLAKFFSNRDFRGALLRSDKKYGCPASQPLKNEAELAKRS